MSSEKFTAQAAALWSTIPIEARKRILENVFCVKCGRSIEIVDFTGRENDGDILLEGKCGKCGHEVARLVETSEIRFETN